MRTWSKISKKLCGKKVTWKKKYWSRSSKTNDKEFLKDNKLTLNSQQRFESGKYDVFTEQVNRIALTAEDNQKT